MSCCYINKLNKQNDQYLISLILEAVFKSLRLIIHDIFLLLLGFSLLMGYYQPDGGQL